MWSQEGFLVSSALAQADRFIWLPATLFLMKEFEAIAKEVKLFQENNSTVTRGLLVSSPGDWNGVVNWTKMMDGLFI